MSVFNINVEGNTAVRLTTAGKYCDRDIVVTPEDLTENLSEQGSLIAQIQTALAEKCVPSAGLPTQEKTVEITENGEFDIVPDDGYTLSKVALTVKVSGDSGDDDLPTGYRRCDFIRFDDAQIVDTGIVCNQNTKIKVLFTRESSDAMYMYGVINDGNTASVTAYLSSGGSWRFGAKSSSRNITVSDDIIHTAVVQKSGITSDTGNSSFSGVDAFETIGTLIIGAVRNASGTVSAAQYVGRIFLFEMWQGSEQVLKLIPVTDGSQYRFWDAVGEKFHDSITATPLDGGNL